MTNLEFGHVPLVKVTRGEAVESIHYGAIAVVDSRGVLLAGAGNPEAATFLRSAAKPFQTLPLLVSGAAQRFRFSDRELAVITSSHSGQKMHLDVVRRILQKAGVKETSLQCGAHAPFHRPTARALAQQGSRPTVLHNNCSGKHAGMLALARHWNVPLEDYLDTAHPVQKAVLETLCSYTGAVPGAVLVGVDGCSAPTFAISLRQAALGYARLLDPRFASGEAREAAQRVVFSMRGYPQMVGGTNRLDTWLMKAIGKSFIAKIGAEGFYGLAYREGQRGIGIALKIADGDGERARTAATVHLLDQLGLLGKAKASEILRSQGLPEIRNVRGRIVGMVSGLFQVS